MNSSSFEIDLILVFCLVVVLRNCTLCKFTTLLHYFYKRDLIVMLDLITQLSIKLIMIKSRPQHDRLMVLMEISALEDLFLVHYFSNSMRSHTSCVITLLFEVRAADESSVVFQKLKSDSFPPQRNRFKKILHKPSRQTHYKWWQMLP